MEVYIDARSVQAAAKRFDTAIRAEGLRALEQTATSVREHIVNGGYWQDHTHAAERSIMTQRTGDLGVQVFSDSKIVGWLNNGTRAHVIRPKAASGFVGPLRQSQSRRKRGTGAPRRYLRFMGNGGIVFARTVNHPGTKRLSFERIEARRAEFVTMPAFLSAARDRAIRAAGF